MHHSAACGHRGRVCPKALDEVQLLGLDGGERPVRRSLQASQAGDKRRQGGGVHGGAILGRRPTVLARALWAWAPHMPLALCLSTLRRGQGPPYIGPLL